METREEIKARFEENTKDHVMTIIRDDELHRHIRFRKPGTVIYRYDLITWPGYLCICGDVGAYIFARVEDMFRFFRNQKINPSYWGEKLKSIGTNAGYEVFSEEVFKEYVKDRFDEWEFESDEQKAEIWKDIELKVLSNACDGSWPAYSAAIGYQSDHGHRFHDFTDGGCGCTEYTFSYIWILYAIVEGIRQYDATKG